MHRHSSDGGRGRRKVSRSSTDPAHDFGIPVGPVQPNPVTLAPLTQHQSLRFDLVEPSHFPARRLDRQDWITQIDLIERRKHLRNLGLTEGDSERERSSHPRGEDDFVVSHRTRSASPLRRESTNSTLTDGRALRRLSLVRGDRQRRAGPPARTPLHRV